MNKCDYYSLAIKKFIDFSSNDPTSSIAKEHGIIGLTRLLMCMDSLNLDLEETLFVAMPDFTYTRNPSRWEAGFPYGCIISLGKTSPLFIPIDFRPNCCGVILVKLSGDARDADYYVKRYKELLCKKQEINKTDFNRRNHFFGVYLDIQNKEYYGLIHGSFSFAKEQLYVEKNLILGENANTFEAIGSKITYLFGDSAERYYEQYLQLEKKTAHLREEIAEFLFPHSDIVFHKIHEGFLNNNVILLGAYADINSFSCPIMLSAESSLPLVNIEVAIDLMKGEKIFCAPHGGGYSLMNVRSASRVSGNEYILEYTNGSKMITDNIIDLPFQYRGNVINVWCNQYKKGHACKELFPLFNFKI